MKLYNSNTIDIILGDITLKGILNLPYNASAIVIFSHGSGSSRLSPRNTYVANQLNKNGFATLLFDLLTIEEDMVYENRFNIELLTIRLIEVTGWVLTDRSTSGLSIGYFGASTGAASALMAAAALGTNIRAVVSRGGRPDLAVDNELYKVTAPTLLIVGGWDDVVITLNQKAFKKIGGEKRLEIIPGATHLFEEPGKLEQVTALSVDWFGKYLNS